MSRGWSDSTDAPTWTAHEPSDTDSLGGLGDLSMRRIGWRRQVLLAAAIIGCLTIFLLARVMANNPDVAAQWRASADGYLELADTSVPELKGSLGKELEAIMTPDGQVMPFGVLAIAHSARWISHEPSRQEMQAVRLATAHALEAGQITLRFRDGSQVTIEPKPRGYAGLGAMFWLMSAFGMVLFLVGWIVPLVQPNPRNLLYAIMAHAQAAQLLISAVAAVPAMALPSAMVAHESLVRVLLDAVTGAAVVQAAAMHPVRMPGRRWVAAVAWGATALFAVLAFRGQLDNKWWWSQSLLIGDGLACIALLTWVHRRSPHPFAIVVRRFAMVTLATLVLLTGAVSLMPMLPPEVQPVATVGPVIWSVFFASIILLVPFISRSQNVMREFAMLAGISTVATSVDLLFVAVFSFSQFTSLTLSLFLALGAYAALRQWLVGQMMGARALTTERMFQHLYRIAREVEARPERAADRMIELLRNVFEPLETERTETRSKQSTVAGNGAALVVPLPNLVDGPSVRGSVVLRFAERGKRLFAQEDARLADRILEQLMRALAHDRAVERGRSEERVRIAQDLHDDIGARLLTLMYKAPSTEMEEYIRHTLQDLKTLTRGLAAKNHPLTLASAEWKTDITLRLEAVHCQLEWEAEYDQDVTLSMMQWSAITRVLRELVSNVIAHAKASRVHIVCQLRQGTFTILVEDDGVGADPAQWSAGLGLGGVRKRAKSLGGTVAWRTRRPHGTLCEVQIPHLTTPEA